MNELIICGVEQQRLGLEELIKIRCLLRDCQFNNGELFQIPSILHFENLGDLKISLYLCRQHQNIDMRAIIYENRLNKQITFCNQEIRKPIKFVQALQPNELLLRQAEIKLDRSSCCIRENIKYINLKQILTLIELISNEDEVILRLVKRILMQNYLEFSELQNEIRRSFKTNKVDILKHFTYQHRQNQIVNKTMSQFKSMIEVSGNLLQPLGSSKDIIQQNKDQHQQANY